MKKILMAFLIALLFLVIIAQPSKVNASSSSTDLKWDTINGKATGFISKGSEAGTSFQAGDLVNGLSNVLTTIGIIIVFAGLLIIGIKYMSASPEEASKLKGKMVGLVVSGIVILGAFGIWKITRNMFANMTHDSSSKVANISYIQHV